MKNRARLLDMNLDRLSYMNYDMKKVEVVITDGFSEDNLMEVIKKHYKKFYQIKFAISDRSELPFKVASNNPAADRNAMVANLPTFEKCIMTDPEVLFVDDNELDFISTTLNDKNAIIWYPAKKLNNGWKYNYDGKVRNWEPMVYCNVGGTNGFCNCVNKSTFIKNRGYEEKYCLGFAAEDSYFIHWYEKNSKSVVAHRKVIHQWHEEPNHNGQYSELYKSYTMPLYTKMLRENIAPNLNNPGWARPEMIKNIQIFKEN